MKKSSAIRVPSQAQFNLHRFNRLSDVIIIDISGV
jgi:hypothetical protein